MSDETKAAPGAGPGADAEVEIEVEYVAPPPKDLSVAVRAPDPGALVHGGLTGQSASMVATAIATVKLQLEMARAYPRNEKGVISLLYQATQRQEFAEKATYHYPRGGTQVVGPTVYFAEEVAKSFGNMNWGSTTIDDNEDYRSIRCYAWDLECNTRKEHDVTFGKKIQRNRGGKTVWETPDERDLLELHNRMAAKGVRNMILALIPDAIKKDALSWAAQTVRKGIAANPAAYRNQLMLAFASKGIKYDMVEKLMGRPLEQVTTEADVQYLRGVFARVRDGEATWDTIQRERAEATGKEPPPPNTAEQLREHVAAAKKPKGGTADGTK